VPFTYKEFETFQTESVPRLDDLVKELESIHEDQKKREKPDSLFPNLAHLTELKKYVEIFVRFLNDYEDKAIRK
jgi:hypothetical protein